jgi:Glycosyltransferase family 92
MLKIFQWLFLLFPLSGFALPSYSLSICAIFQNEAPYLKEWIEFHRLVGVQHFYLYNHCSKDDYAAVLQPYLASGLVELQTIATPAPGIKKFNALQLGCYNECLKCFGAHNQWIAFLDVDEYLMPMQQNSLISVLKEFEKFGGVGVNWLVFGTSGIKKLDPSQLLIESLTRCSTTSYAVNKHIKSIVQPRYTSHFVDPHYAIYRDDYYQVNTDKIPFDGRYSTYMRTNKLRINHYWTKDEEFFYREKIPRQKRWGGTPLGEKKWGGTPLIESLLQQMNVTEDRQILRFAPALKQALKGL